MRSESVPSIDARRSICNNKYRRDFFVVQLRDKDLDFQSKNSRYNDRIYMVQRVFYPIYLQEKNVSYNYIYVCAGYTFVCVPVEKARVTYK